MNANGSPLAGLLRHISVAFGADLGRRSGRSRVETVVGKHNFCNSVLHLRKTGQGLL